MVRLNRPTINYGLCEVDKTSDAELIVSNTSSGVEAAWTLAVAEGSANGGEVLFLPAGGTIAPGEEAAADQQAQRPAAAVRSPQPSVAHSRCSRAPSSSAKPITSIG